MEIKKELKEYLFGAISETIPIDEFESWLYTQTELVEDLENELNLSLFTFDYKRSGAVYEFTKIVTPFLDEAELKLWRSKAYLSVLAIGKEDTLHAKALGYFNDWDYDKCTLLHYLGSGVFDYWSRNNDPIDKLKSDLRKYALELLIRITIEESKMPGFEISKFPYFEMKAATNIKTEIIEEISTKKWWQLWK